MRSDVRSRPFNFAAQVLAGGEATLVRTSQRRFRIKGEDDEEPAALVEPEDRPRPALADEPLDPVVLRNRAKNRGPASRARPERAARPRRPAAHARRPLPR